MTMPQTIQNDWPDPGPISATRLSGPYPVDSLPEIIRNAVVEYQQYGQQPLPVVAGAALAQVALACQGLADVARDSQLRSPISVNFLTLAESGERKTAADRHFGRAAEAWERKRREESLGDHRKAQAMAKARDARMKGLAEKIKAMGSSDEEEQVKQREKLEARLCELEQEPVWIPPLPKLSYEDVTAEGLAYDFATGWPSALFASNEGGLFVGGAGMSEESALRLLTLLNRLWDGLPFEPTRKTAKTAPLVGRRLSSHLMIQPELLETVIKRGARGVGFLARYLLSHPVSTMGTRFYREPAQNMPALAAFARRITDLLDHPLPIDREGDDKGLAMRLRPPAVLLNRAAMGIWIDLHDKVENELRSDGDFATVRDVAAKAAENAARLAALFQIFDEGNADRAAILEQHMATGAKLSEWYLREALALFFEADEPQSVKDAIELSGWLTGRARDIQSGGKPIILDGGRIQTRHISQYGPGRFRGDRERRDRALDVLAHEEVAHLRIVATWGARSVELNPKLLRHKAF